MENVLKEEQTLLLKPRKPLEHVRVANPVMAGRVQIFGLRWDAARDLAYTTLDDAMAANTREKRSR